MTLTELAMMTREEGMRELEEKGIRTSDVLILAIYNLEGTISYGYGGTKLWSRPIINALRSRRRRQDD